VSYGLLGNQRIMIVCVAQKRQQGLIGGRSPPAGHRQPLVSAKTSRASRRRQDKNELNLE
jgi:hypothetical protein